MLYRGRSLSLLSIHRAPVLILTLISTQLRYFASFSAKNMDKNRGISFVDAEMARNIDERLMSQSGFSIDQLMELAGYSVASAANDFLSTVPQSAKLRRKVAVFCGPGNNGGDGLVAARHLRHFGYSPEVIYPKKSKGQLFDNLVRQCEDLDISVSDLSPRFEELDRFDLIIDGIFGFSFKGPARAPFSSMLAMFTATKTPILSIDLPSGWDVNEGDIHGTFFTPTAVISLTLPKRCMVDYQGRHYVGGRFMPPKLAAELALTMPDYGPSSSQILLLSEGRTQTTEKQPIVAMFSTTSSEEEATNIANHLIQQKIAACVNIIPKIQSVYEWEGKVEQSREYLLMIKTKESLTVQVTNAIKSLHSYSVPESIVVDIKSEGSNPDYLSWIMANTGTASSK